MHPFDGEYGGDVPDELPSQRIRRKRYFRDLQRQPSLQQLYKDLKDKDIDTYPRVILQANKVANTEETKNAVTTNLAGERSKAIIRWALDSVGEFEAPYADMVMTYLKVGVFVVSLEPIVYICVCNELKMDSYNECNLYNVCYVYILIHTIHTNTCK